MWRETSDGLILNLFRDDAGKALIFCQSHMILMLVQVEIGAGDIWFRAHGLLARRARLDNCRVGVTRWH